MKIVSRKLFALLAFVCGLVFANGFGMNIRLDKVECARNRSDREANRLLNLYEEDCKKIHSDIDIILRVKEGCINEEKLQKSLALVDVRRKEYIAEFIEFINPCDAWVAYNYELLGLSFCNDPQLYEWLETEFVRKINGISSTFRVYYKAKEQQVKEQLKTVGLVVTASPSRGKPDKGKRAK